MNWKPIDTAERSAVRILMFEPTYKTSAKGVFVGFWDQSRGWVADPGRYKKQPTHWQPLPEPPDSSHIASRIRGESINDR